MGTVLQPPTASRRGRHVPLDNDLSALIATTLGVILVALIILSALHPATAPITHSALAAHPR